MPPLPAQRAPEHDTTWADGLDDTELVTLAQISEALGVDRVTLHGWVKRNLLQARYVNDVGHPMYSLVDAHAVHLRMKLRGAKVTEAAAVWGWSRRPGQPWALNPATASPRC